MYTIRLKITCEVVLILGRQFGDKDVTCTWAELAHFAKKVILPLQNRPW